MTSSKLHVYVAILVGLGALVTALTGAKVLPPLWEAIATAAVTGLGAALAYLGLATPTPGSGNSAGGTAGRASLAALLVLLVGAALALCMLAPLAQADDTAPPMVSLARATAGVTLAGGMTQGLDGMQASTALPSAYAAYSVTSVLSAATSAEYDSEAHRWAFRGGARALLTPAADRTALALAVDAVRYDGSGAATLAKPGSWTASLRGAWAAWQVHGTDRADVVASVEYDPDNALTTYRAGLRVPLLGAR